MKQQTDSGRSVRRSKKGIIAAAAVILASGAGMAFYTGANASASTEARTDYREYSVSKGNITVGISESGTATVGRSYASLPVNAEIEEIYIKTGTKVSAGDKIAKLNTDDIDEIKAQYESKILSAKLELDEALSEKDVRLAEAKNTYDTSVGGADTAEEVYELSVTKIQSDISDAEKKISDLKKQLAEYEDMLEAYPSDNEKYSEYESKYGKYSDTYEQYGDTYAGYEKTLKTYEKELETINKEYNEYIERISENQETIKELKDAVESTEAAYKAAAEKYEEAKEKESSSDSSQSSSGSSGSDSQTQQTSSAESALSEMNKAYTAYQEAKNNYSSRYVSLDKTYSRAIDGYEEKLEAQQEKIDAYKDMMEEYANMMSDYSKEMNSFKTEFDEYKEDFGEIYGNSDKEDIEEKIESLKAEIAAAEYELSSLKLNESGSELSAGQKKQDAVLAAENAETVYNLAVEKINREISEKQEAYDELCSEYNELLDNMGDGVYIYADCDGQAASVNVEAGDSVMADQNIAVLTDLSQVYVSVAVSEYDIASLYVGQAASAVFSAYENVTFDGEIDAIAVEPARSSGSVTYTVTVKINSDDKYDIREGMSCDVTFLQKQVTDVLYTNVNAVDFRDGASYVRIYDENGNVAEKQVTTGFSDGRYVELSSGVSAGDKVLAEIELSENKRKD